MEKNIIVRPTTSVDYSTVYNLIQTAFETAEHTDGDEQNFAVNLRNSQNYIPELDLVAELDGRLIGHIMFTKIFVTKPDGSKYTSLMVAPLSVLLEYRSMGIGSKLMEEGCCIAASLGYKTAFLLGEPNYYQRFGFKQTHLYGIGHESYPAEYLMVKELLPGALNGITGIVHM